MQYVLLWSLFVWAQFVTPASISLPSYPLAVKNPYLSTWLPYDQSLDVPNAVPQFWAGQPLTWPVLARVNGVTFALFGCPACGVTPAKQSSLMFTSTHTEIKLKAADVNFTLDFFSPVSVKDYVRQSLPYSYLTVTAHSGDVARPTIEIFSGIDESWTAQHNKVNAVFQRADNTQMFVLSGTESIPFTELNDMATYGDTVFASRLEDSDRKLSCASGPQTSLVSTFSGNGSLAGQSTVFSPGDVVACAHVLGRPSGSVSVTFAVGLQRDEAINYFDGIRNATQTGYYRSHYKTVPEAVSHFLMDYEAAYSESRMLDRRVVDMGERLSKNYSDILEASVRQSFGGLEVTIPADTYDTGQALAFMKEISTDGNVNTVADLLPKSMPIFYVLAPEYIRLLVEPVLKFSYSWPLKQAVHAIGKHYPNATGVTPGHEESLPLDSTSVLFWMVYGYHQASGNTAWVKPHIPLLRKYADYLVENGLYPAPQRSSVDKIGASRDQTVLAMSAAISLKAFGALSGKDYYTRMGDEYALEVFYLGTDTLRTHFLTHYGDSYSSWLITYPLAYDKLLKLNTFGSAVYQMQSIWYLQHQYPFGIPFSNAVKYTVLEFEFCAAATSSPEFQHFAVDSVHRYLTNGMNDIPGPTQWYVTGNHQGAWMNLSMAKSIMGSTFLIAAVNEGGCFHMQFMLIAIVFALHIGLSLV